jgi:hypothetical protein
MSHNIVFIFTLRYIPRHFVVGATFQASSIVSAVKRIFSLLLDFEWLLTKKDLFQLITI